MTDRNPWVDEFVKIFLHGLSAAFEKAVAETVEPEKTQPEQAEPETEEARQKVSQQDRDTVQALVNRMIRVRGMLEESRLSSVRRAVVVTSLSQIIGDAVNLRDRLRSSLT